MKAKVYIFITALLIGTALGYFWRMAQVEPLVSEEVNFVYKQNQRLTRDLTQLELRVTLLEDKVRGLKRR